MVGHEVVYKLCSILHGKKDKNNMNIVWSEYSVMFWHEGKLAKLYSRSQNLENICEIDIPIKGLETSSRLSITYHFPPQIHLTCTYWTLTQPAVLASLDYSYTSFMWSHYFQFPEHGHFSALNISASFGIIVYALLIETVTFGSLILDFLGFSLILLTIYLHWLLFLFLISNYWNAPWLYLPLSLSLTNLYS